MILIEGVKVKLRIITKKYGSYETVSHKIDFTALRSSQTTRQRGGYNKQFGCQLTIGRQSR